MTSAEKLQMEINALKEENTFLKSLLDHAGILYTRDEVQNQTWSKREKA